nr:hypothetical protein [Tanacetum cinerariifolium]
MFTLEDANSSLPYFTFVGGRSSFSSRHSSFDSDNDLHDDTSETNGDDLFNFLSKRDLDLQFPKPTKEEWPIPLKVEFSKQSEERCPKPESIFTCRVAQPHYGLRSLGPKEEDVFVVKSPSSLVKVTNAILGFRATNADMGCSSKKRTHKGTAFPFFNLCGSTVG